MRLFGDLMSVGTPKTDPNTESSLLHKNQLQVQCVHQKLVSFRFQRSNLPKTY